MLLEVLLLLAELLLLLPELLMLLLERGEGSSRWLAPNDPPYDSSAFGLTGGGVDVVNSSARADPRHVEVVIVILRRILPPTTWT